MFPSYAARLTTPPGLDRRFRTWLYVSLTFHALIIMGIGMHLQVPVMKKNLSPPLEIILVNSKSGQKPYHAKALAQANLEGGGNTDAKLMAKSPFIATHSKSYESLQQKQAEERQLEAKLKTLLATTKPDGYRIIGPSGIKNQSNLALGDHQAATSRAIKIRSLEAKISKEVSAYEKRPRRKFIGARTSEYRFALYVEHWRRRVERIGNLNYPQNIRALGLHGSLEMTVSILADGKLDGITINRSSGNALLDSAAKEIVRMAVPFPPFPPDIRKDTDILSITRTYIFTRSDSVKSE
ncbi:MAG: energy transducer TonB [Pseudomonadota bacterium]|nr:energy transducer TonB [Pseudomonadota bacterium]